MAINVTTSKQQIQAAVADEKITATVSAGFGPVGPQGPAGSLPAGADGQVLMYVGGEWTAASLPSYVDDVLEVASIGNLTGTGETGKIYVVKDTNRVYRWSGSTYIEVSPLPASTDSVPEGVSNLYFTNYRALAAVTWSTLTGKPTFATIATSGSASDLSTGTVSASRLPIAAAGTLGAVRIGSGISIDGSGVISASSGYTLPVATDSVLGGVKIGSGVTITDGVISVSTSYAAASHAHGNITNAGAIGSTSGQIVVTTTSGVLTTASTISASSVSGLATVATSGSYADLSNIPSTFTPAAHNQAWSTITSTPTTLSGYGITDAVASNDSRLTDARTPTSHSHAASDTTSGTFDIARIPTGTSSTTVSLGDHTHSQLHDRSHAITSTSDHTAGNWKVLYTNGSGQVVELALGSSGQALLSNGASAAPSWGSAGSSSASDLTSGTLAYARMADPTVTSPSQITASQNDYASFARGVNRFTTNGAYNLTGMAAGSDGEIRVICNVGTTTANTLTIKDESTSSTAGNRFSVPWNSDCVIQAEGSVVVFYDGTSSRWRVL